MRKKKDCDTEMLLAESCMATTWSKSRLFFILKLGKFGVVMLSNVVWLHGIFYFICMANLIS